MEHKLLNGVDIDDSTFSHSPVNNSHTTNNYYGNRRECESGQSSDYAQLRSQLDRIEQTLNFIMQHIVSK